MSTRTKALPSVVLVAVWVVMLYGGFFATAASAAEPGPHVFATIPAVGAQASIETTRIALNPNGRGVAYTMVVEDPDGISSLGTARSFKVVAPGVGTVTLTSTFAYVAGSGETKAVITAVHRNTSLAEGVYTPTLTVTDKTGYTTGYTWNFDGYYSKPHVNAHTPERDRIAQSPTSMISANVSGGTSALVSATMKVDGATVGATLTKVSNTVNTLQWTPPTPLSAGEHTAEITATNAAGLSNSYSWTFYASSQQPAFNNIVPSDGSIVLPDAEGMVDVYALFQDLDGIDHASVTFTVHTPLGGQIALTPSTNVRVANKRQNVDASARFVAPPQAGTFVVIASARDLLGNVAGRFWTFSLPSSRPEIDMAAPGLLNDGEASRTKQTRVKARLRGVGGDLDLSSVRLYVDGGLVTHSTRTVDGGVEAYVDLDLADNSHHSAQVSVSSTLGQESSYVWEFDVAASPAASLHKPVAGSIYKYEDVPVSIRFTEPDDGIDVGTLEVYFDGARVEPTAVTAALSSGNDVLDVSTTVRNVGGAGSMLHTAAVAVADTRGLTTTETWSFTVDPQTGQADMTVNTNEPCLSSGCHNMAQTDIEAWNRLHWVVGDVRGWDVPATGWPHRYNCSICHYGERNVTTGIIEGKPMHVAGLDPCYMCHAVPGGTGQAVGLHGGDGEPREFTFEDHYDESKYEITTPGAGRDCLYCHQGQKGTQEVENLFNGRETKAHDIVDDHRVRYDDTWCALCHSAVLSREHAYDRDGAGPMEPLVCDDCHDSTRPEVIGAIRSYPALRFRFWGTESAVYNTYPVPNPPAGIAPYSVETTGYAEVAGGELITGARVRITSSTLGTLKVEGYADGAWTVVYSKQLGGAGDLNPGGRNSPKAFPQYAEAVEEFTCEPVQRVRIRYEPITAGWHYVTANVDSWVLEGDVAHENSESCANCHTDRPPTHGYNAADHQPETSASVCFSGGCHVNADLLALHSTSVAGFEKPCELCHTTNLPFESADCQPCHTDKMDEGGAVIPHGEADPLKHTATAAQVSTLTGTWLAPGDNATYNPPYSYSAGCSSCHEMIVNTEHAKTTSSSATAGCSACHPSPRDTLTPWQKSCVQAGCHVVGGASAQHGSELASHTVGASVVSAGCSFSWREGGVTRYACHYRDLVQEHNRTIMNFGTIAVSCVQCHSSTGFASLTGGWNGSCTGCHPQSHGVEGSAREVMVHAQHNNPTGQYSNAAGTRIGDNVMDSHGAIRRLGGCNTIYCHTQAWAAPGTGAPAGPSVSCSDCHGPNIIQSALEPYAGEFMWFSGSGDNLTNSLTLDPMVLPAGAYLDFQTYFNIEPYYDRGVVQVSVNNGPWTGVDSNIAAFSNGSIFGSTGEWVLAHYDLSAYAGQSVRIRFLYQTDYIEVFPGWWLDEIVIGGTDGPVFTDGAETLLPQWTTSGWTRTN